MKSPTAFYSQQLQKHQGVVKSLFKKLTSLSLVRLFVFLATCIGIYLSFSVIYIAIPIGVLGTICFLFLLTKYTDVKYQYNLQKKIVTINEEELKVASGDFYHRDEGSQYQKSSHEFSLDIDLFGKGSFYQFMNRTSINEGANTLVKALTSNNIKNISLRQEAIKELSKRPEWRQQFTAIASLIKVETSALQIIDWLRNHNTFLPKLMAWLPLAFTLITIIILGLCVCNAISFVFLGYWLLAGLGVTGLYLKKINILSYNTDKVKDTFRQYASLLNQIEKQDFKSQLLKEKQNHIHLEQKKASTIFLEFSKHLDALDNRNNLIAALFGNGFFLSDIKNSFKIEKWISEHKMIVDRWFEVVSFFDAYNTLGNFAFNHPEYVFPEITDDKVVIDAKDLGHPLLDVTKRIASDVKINNQQFFIVTGANMAGKSTFLRTISLHIVMANIGLPVCAKSSQYHPVKLITSMRTSDSLTEDSSYFFSELTRLKFIVDAIEDESYFIILDEILKGTNSTDKAIGSRKFVEKLVSKSATGIIATHDLSLCEIEKELDDVKNYYFDAKIINDELFFDYKLKPGICQNMNASFLLNKMEII